MKKIVKLTETDLVRLVKKVIKEQKFPLGKKGYLGHNDRWYDEMDRPVKGEFDYDEEIEFGPDDFEDYINHTEMDFPENRWSFSQKGRNQDRTPGKGYWDRYQQDGPVKLRKKKMDESGSKPAAYHDLAGGWYDTDNYRVDEPTDYSEEMSFGPEDYDKFIKFIKGCNASWCLKTKHMYKRYTDEGNIKVRK